MTSVRIIGPGRAGTSLALALTNVGWDVAPMLGRDDDVTDAAVGVRLLVVATPDDVIADVASEVRPIRSTVVAHLSGSRGLDTLAGHERRAAIHPLVALPTPEVGSRRLFGAWYAVTGDELADKVVAALGGRSFPVDDDRRATYHAAATIASNHLVALLGQVERLADEVGVPFEAYLDLVRATVANVAELGPRRALTGPASRGDEATIRRHVRSLPTEERKAYRGMVDAARRLAAQPLEPAPASGDDEDGRSGASRPTTSDAGTGGTPGAGRDTRGGRGAGGAGGRTTRSGTGTGGTAPGGEVATGGGAATGRAGAGGGAATGDRAAAGGRGGSA